MSGTDVVVCGAGVGGLATACALGGLGLRVLLVDKQPEIRPVAKGEVFQPGSLPMLRAWGVAGHLEKAGALRLDRLVARDPDGTARMTLDYGLLPTGSGNWLLAHDYPAILRAFTDALPPSAELRRGTVVDDLLGAADGRVTGVRLRDGEEVKAALVVAADGISSRLRRAAGLDVERVEYPHRLVAMELTDAPEVDPDFSAYVTPRGLRLRYALPGGRVRLYAQVAPDELRGADESRIGELGGRSGPGHPGARPASGGAARCRAPAPDAAGGTCARATTHRPGAGVGRRQRARRPPDGRAGHEQRGRRRPLPGRTGRPVR